MEKQAAGNFSVSVFLSKGDSFRLAQEVLVTCPFHQIMNRNIIFHVLLLLLLLLPP